MTLYSFHQKVEGFKEVLSQSWQFLANAVKLWLFKLYSASGWCGARTLWDSTLRHVLEPPTQRLMLICNVFFPLSWCLSPTNLFLLVFQVISSSVTYTLPTALCAAGEPKYLDDLSPFPLNSAVWLTRAAALYNALHEIISMLLWCCVFTCRKNVNAAGEAASHKNTNHQIIRETFPTALQKQNHNIIFPLDALFSWVCSGKSFPACLSQYDVLHYG